MESSIVLARIFAIYFVTMGISMLINPSFLNTVVQDLRRSSIAMFIIAATTLILGSILVVLHNIWSKDWRVFITLICWVILISGIIRTLFPKQIMKIAPSFSSDKLFRITALIMIIMGLGFGYLGFAPSFFAA